MNSVSEKDPIFQQLIKDERKGVQKLIEQHKRARNKSEQEKNEFEKLKQFEDEARGKGFNIIAGIDEVGRGPLAGPVLAASVVLPEDFYLAGLNDSKKLSEAKREEYYEYIKKNATGIGVGL